MAGVERKGFGNPDRAIELKRGRISVLDVDGEQLIRSDLRPGWSWDDENGADAPSCPMSHREYVVAGRIRYRMDDGSDTTGEPGDVLLIPAGHRAEVVGDEECVLIDW